MEGDRVVCVLLSGRRSRTFVPVQEASLCLYGCFPGAGLLKVRLPKWPLVGVLVGWVQAEAGPLDKGYWPVPSPEKKPGFAGHDYGQDLCN